MRTRSLAPALLAVLAACATPPPPPAPPPAPAPAPAPAAPAPPAVAWTARPRVVLHLAGRDAVVERPFTRLQVLGADSGGVRVHCTLCPAPLAGVVALADLVSEPLSPHAAARGELGPFVLALRDAVSRRDLDALLAVMASDFSFSFVGQQGPANALAAWRAEGFTTLQRAPDLLDRGLSTRDSVLWTAPPEHSGAPGYTGLRLGVQRTPAGRWEWVFLIQGVLER